MSLLLKVNKGYTKKGGIVALGLAGLFVMFVVSAPLSGAWFQDAHLGSSTVTGATLNLSVDGGPGRLDFAAENLAPGQSQTNSIMLTNTGSIAGTLRFSMGDAVVSGTGSPDASRLSYTVYDASDSKTLTSTGGTFDVGVLQPGESRAINVMALLDPMAGNEWQGAIVTNQIAVVLAQQ